VTKSESATETVGADTTVAKKRPGMGDVFRALGRPKIAIMLALGFSSGLPFLLTAGTLGFWLRDAGASLTAIGFASWVGLAYVLKFLWSPVIDRFDAPILGKLLGRRRGWMLIAQVLVAGGLIAMAMITPAGGLGPMVMAAVVVAFASATQDIVVDAWRIEAASNDEELGLLSSSYALGYRVAIIVADALILIIAKHSSWSISYFVMAAFMAVGIIGVMCAVEPPPAQRPAVDKSDRIGRQDYWMYLLFIAVGGAILVGVTGLLQMLHAAIEQTGFKPETAQAANFIGLSLLLLPIAVISIKRAHDRGRGAVWVLPLVLSVAAQIAWLVQAGVVGTPFAQIHANLMAEVHSGALKPLTILALLGLLGELWWLVDLGLMGSAPANKYGASPAPRPWKTLLWGTFEPALGPFVEFFRKYGWLALLMFAFITLYRLPEFVMGPMATPFYSDLHLDKDVIGGVRATFGLAGSILGIAFGGMLVARLGYLKGLIAGGIFQALAIGSFALLGVFGATPGLFAGVMMFDNFGVSIAGVALVTYMSSLTSLGYTAVQYAVLSSAYAFVGKILKGFSGQVVDGLKAAGHPQMEAYAIFFVGAGLVGIPAIFLCLWLTWLSRKRVAAEPAA
jgi:PAT family beta-lactamase induction signal transducer AmpG